VDAETRYARRGRAHLAYRVSGDGPAIVWLNGTYVPMDATDDHPLIAHFIARLQDLGRLVLTDRRGVGHSDALSSDDELTPENWAEDLVAVLDAADIDRASVIAGFADSHAAVALAALHPDRVERLCLVNGYVSGPRVAAGIANFREYAAALDEGFEGRDLDMVEFVAPSVASDPRFRTWFDSAGTRGASPGTALRLSGAMFEWNIEALLPRVSTPTLVLHREENRLIPLEEAEALANGIADATLRVLPGADHVAWVGDTSVLLDAIEGFITGAVASRTSRSLATVLFTDLVASTESAARLGDRRWRELLDVHDSTARRIIRRHHGELVKSTGDGLLALFDTPGAAIRAAKDLQADIHAVGLEMRAGIHTGEIERRGDDVGGIAVHVAARVQALAGAGEIVVSSVIPALTSGAGFQFDDLGDHQLKGVPGDWRLYRAG
jgi:class 3 adenylate cyclase